MKKQMSVPQSDVFAEALLQRRIRTTFSEDIHTQIHLKKVLITGAGGSIGSEICRQVYALHPAEIILVGHGENSIYMIQHELMNLTNQAIKITAEIQEIQDKKGIRRLMEKIQPDFVFHAAAHKHVPLMQNNPHSAVANNIIGTKNVAEAAGEVGVETFVLVSTDKAVEPQNVMGASKRIAEMIVAHLNHKYETNYTTVRFGNVLASRGSVVPLFLKQIDQGGPLTLTDSEMTRYFMTIEEAASLVVKAGTMTTGGDIFVLNMGDAVKIKDIAKRLITMSGKQNIAIQYTGIRDGEKLHEGLLEVDERIQMEETEEMFIGKAIVAPECQIDYLLINYEMLSKEALTVELLKIANRNEVQIPMEV
ncbi:UDP-N-acetylglucosamine 4,6-dehydratase family protein [Listeria newyorkensis]|uniref:Polysaccharide biosynthesis protein n=1 Tax=Listeria newyorkensis TaxID=1497681 RepID=A0A841YVB0_9LIST|nr:polysaccharide biosynthesis protein [Listeria newyorkensis]MBC1457218.1 polysaccharide biosynthesis protein [Listeria newyorkensis]